MVYLYYCQACEKGDHKNCEIGTPMQKGCISGGSKCRCPCSGDPLYNDPQRIHEECVRLLGQISRADKLSRETHLTVGKPKKYGKDLPPKRPKKR